MGLNGVNWPRVRISTLFGDDQHMAYFDTLNADLKLPDVIDMAQKRFSDFSYIYRKVS